MYRVFQVGVTLLVLGFAGPLLLVETLGGGFATAIARGDLRDAASSLAMLSTCLWFSMGLWISTKAPTRAAVLFVLFAALGASGWMGLLAFGSHDGFSGPCPSGRGGTSCEFGKSLYAWGGDLAVAARWLPVAAAFYFCAYKVRADLKARAG